MSDFIEIGGAPAYESCAATGVTADALRYNRLECRAYIVALRKRYGPEPGDSQLRTKTNPHEFGSYCEVVYAFDGSDPAQRDYATAVESGLATWQEVGMWPPVTYDDRSQPVLVIEREDLWDRATNPQCLNT